MGYEIAGIVCDGRRGLLRAFGDIPVQTRRSHQQKTVRKYLTSKPKTDAARKLKRLSDTLAKTDKESFVGAFEEWHERWRGYPPYRRQADEKHSALQMSIRPIFQRISTKIRLFAINSRLIGMRNGV